jgi:sodium transport system permease protein
MRWSIIRLILLRELRDQLRDRRTLFMIAVLPVLIYPIAGFGVLKLAVGFLQQQSVVGVQGSEYLPRWSPRCVALSPLPATAWLSLTPPPPGVPLAGVERVLASAAWAHAHLSDSHQDYPPLFEEDKDGLHFVSLYLKNADEADYLTIRRYDNLLRDSLSNPDDKADPDLPDYLRRIDRTPLDNRQVDLLLVVPPDFQQQLEQNGRPAIYLLARDKDDHSRLVNTRVRAILNRWKSYLKDVRLVRRGLPADFDDPFEAWDAEQAKSAGKRATEELFEILVKVFPFILVLWSLAGALYPAVDLCAGEKERGTMETLLITPASREEIVWGKFLTIWLFSAATALLNLASMALTTWQFSSLVPHDTVRVGALFWGVVLLLPLSAFFSALCLAVGAYARSSKEGQYYLMPLFLVTMPLIFLTLAPGVELNAFYSMVPVTGVALLLQKLMAAGMPDRALWLYFLPVLAPMVLYCWLALRWAIEQFQREDVLFREAERLDLGLWLRSLFVQKEDLPGKAHALFCFGLILTLQWISVGATPALSVPRLIVANLAFVAAPPLFMALLLTARPRLGLGLQRPPWWAWLAAALLGLFLFLPLEELRSLILQQQPGLVILAEQARVWTKGSAGGTEAGQLLVALVILPAVCEELAFRGFMFSGFCHRFRPGSAIFLSSFLFALYSMSVDLFVPQFLFGVVLALLVLRSGSVLPAMLCRLIPGTLAFLLRTFPNTFWWDSSMDSRLGDDTLLRALLATGSALLAAAVLVAVWILGRGSANRRSTPGPGENRPRPESLLLASQTPP